jgi:iron complex transport system substrate-binding protein
MAQIPIPSARWLRTGWGIALAAMLSACGQPGAISPPAHPLRVVSLDYCADQYVLKLLPRARIAAVSPYADAEESYMRAAAAGVRKVRPNAEDVLVLRPDLVVRTFGGGADAPAMFARAGVPVLQLGYAENLEGVRRVLVETANGLGESARGAAIARDFDRRLAALNAGGAGRSVLYVTPGGVTSGPGTLVDESFKAAGLRNFEDRGGWNPLPLERLAYAKPDVIAAAFFDTRYNHPDPWSAATHPVAREGLKRRPHVALPGAWTACGGWFLLDAVEALATAAR